MFDTTLPYRAMHADNHFSEPPGITEPHLEQQFHDRVAIDDTPGEEAE